MVGRVWRDVGRQLDKMPTILRDRASDLLAKAKRLLTQKPRDINKLYSLHEPEAECIAKGKTRQPYEFGVKVSIAATHKEGLVVGMRSMPGNLYDGHTLYETLEQVAILTEQQPKEVFVDLGYCGAEVQAGTKVYHHKLERSAIEPAIGHMKNDGRLRLNWLKVADGDAFNALLCGCGHNLEMILRKLRLFFAFIAAWMASLHLIPGLGVTLAALVDGAHDNDRPQTRLCLRRFSIYSGRTNRWEAPWTPALLHPLHLPSAAI